MQLSYKTPYSDDKTLWDLALSRYHLPAVSVANKLNIFECIHNGSFSINLLAQKLNIDILGIETLTCLLASLGILNKNQKKS